MTLETICDSKESLQARQARKQRGYGFNTCGAELRYLLVLKSNSTRALQGLI